MQMTIQLGHDDAVTGSTISIGWKSVKCVCLTVFVLGKISDDRGIC
jgi:hypothetical protein